MWITGNELANICKFRLNYNPNDARNKNDDDNIIVENINDNDLIFVKTDYMDKFILKYFNKIQKKFVLVTHNSDVSFSEKYKKILDSDKIIKCYSQNISFLHEKLFPIPIGMANNRIRLTGIIIPHSNQTLINSIIIPEKKFKVYADFHFNFEKYGYRKKAYNILKNNPLVEFIEKRTDFENNWKTISTYQFIISPHGNGLDCHRTWESLILKTIPIVLTSTLDKLYDNLPVIILDNWNDLNEELLRNFLLNLDFNVEKCKLEYWKSKLHKR